MTATNPFCKAYDAVFNLLFGGTNNELANLVKVNNRISFGSAIDKDRDPTKHSIASADNPEVWLVDNGGMLNLHANSSSLSYDQTLSLVMATGDWRYGKFASLLNWYTVVNMSQWRSTLLAGTLWNGKPFIKNITNIPIQIASDNPQRANAVAGWNDIWRMTLQLRIDNVDIVYKES